MRFLRLLFPTYFRRLRWEIAGWWLLSGSLSLLVLTGRELKGLHGLALAEIVVALWMTLRLALIDDAFGTLAGRHWRPLRGREILAARLLLIVVVGLPPLLLRFIAWQRWAMPDAGMWRDYLLWVLSPSVFLLFAGASIQLVSTLARWTMKRGRKTATVVIAVLAGWFLLRSGLRSMGSVRMGYDGVPGAKTLSWHEAVRGVRALLPEDALLLGSWASQGIGESYLPMRELARIPLREGRVVIEPGVEAVIKEPELDGPELKFHVRLRCRDRETSLKYQKTNCIVRYRNGAYADLNGGGRGESLISPVMLLPLRDLVIEGTVITPGIVFWRDAGKGAGTENADLILYTRDEGAPAVAIKPDPCYRDVRKGDPLMLPAIFRKHGSRSSLDGEFDMYTVVPDEPGTSAEDRIRGCLLLAGSYGEWDPRILDSAMALGRAAIPPLLARPVWSDTAWENIVRPVLMAHVIPDDRAALLERLETEPRLSAVFLAKGWSADAMPVLRAKAADGLPLDVDSLKILAASKEESLAGDLKRCALVSPLAADELDALLRDFPGFDWQGYASESWRLQRFRPLPMETIRQSAARAAGEGDASAFRHIAEQAVQEERGYEELLRQLVAGQPQDVVAQVRASFDALRFDPASRTWR